MFTVEELIYINNILSVQGSEAESIVDKINSKISGVNGYNKSLWSFYWDCERMGSVEGIFKATKEEIENAFGKEVYFGEILGKHSEIYGVLEEDDVQLEATDPLIVLNAVESGYNPLEYMD